jgi:predicted alpha/beta hydrolase family esterase
MKQLVVIGGGNEFPTYDAYLSHLKNFQAESVDYFKERRDWKSNLQEALGDDYEVLLPQMPCKGYARYLEWKIWFEKMFPFLNDGVILIGHSLGVSFLVNYLQHHGFPKYVLATFLVAGPYDKGDHRKMKEFMAPSAFMYFTEYAGQIFFYHSEDDPIVPFSELSKYRKHFDVGRVKMNIFETRGHFNQETFPELVEDIKSL